MRVARRLLAAAHRLDAAAFGWVAGRHGPVLDRAMPALSRATDHGVLWLVTAAGLAATGRPGLRRAGLRGVASLGLASATTNGLAKLATRRPRPPLDGVPLARRVRRLPVTTSFPSGHSASAAAFATGVAREVPALAVPVGLVAAAVGASRVWTGAHYPADVLAGAGLGAALAAALPALPRGAGAPPVARAARRLVRPAGRS